MASRWFSAVEQGHVATIVKLMKRGAAVDSRDSWGRTALMLAAYRRQVGSVRVLLDHGADPNAESRTSWTAMTFAVMYPPSRYRGRRGWPVAPSREIWEFLKAGGGKHRLREAVILGDVELAQAAYDAGESSNGPARWGMYETSLMLAADFGHVEMVRFLLDQGADIEGENDLCERALKRAAQAGHADLVALLLDRGADIDSGEWPLMTPLAVAAMNGHETIVTSLLSRGAHRMLLDAIASDDVTLVDHLLREGADPNEFCVEASRFAMYAVGRGNLSIVRLLMDHGAVHLKDYPDYHPLLAEASCRGHLDIVRLLVERGADLHQVGRDGQTALAWAIREGHDEVADYLRQVGTVR